MTDFVGASVGTTAVSSGGQANGELATIGPPENVDSVDFDIGQGPPVPTFLNIEADFQQAYTTTDFAKQHAAAADGYIAKLGDLAASLVPPTINPTFVVNQNAPTITTPLPPDLLDIDYQETAVPAPFAGTLDISGIDYPVFDAQPPSLLFPAAPTLGQLDVPASPAVDLNYTYPEVSINLPDAPELLSIDIRPFDGVTFPNFDMEAPVLTLMAPQVTQYVAGAPYTDALLSGLIGECERRLSIGVTGSNTGLPAAVEQNIWNRGREREAKQLAADLDALDRMESMGYALPPGVFIDSQIKVRTEYGAVSAGLSREVMVKQAELEQANISKAMDIAVQIEGKLIDYANLRDQRQFDAAKYATEAGVSIYNAGVQAYTARVQGYRAAVDVYTAQIAGARAIVDVYTAQVQAERLKVDANAALIQEYKARIDAALASIQVFEGEIKIIEARAQVENLKVSIYGEQIKAYAAQVNVFTSEVEAYKSQVAAEGAKESIFQTQAQVYGSLVDATAKQIGTRIEVFKAQLANKSEEYEAFKAIVGSEAEKVKAIAAANSAIADVYKAEVQGTASYNEAMVKEWESINNLNIQIAQVGVSAAQANGQLYLTARSVATDAAKVGATVEAQIAASALGAVTYTTHRSRQDSAGLSASRSYGESKSMSRGQSSSTGINYSQSVSTSTSSQISASTSSSTSTVHNVASVE